jgi:hypothetical protein
MSTHAVRTWHTRRGGVLLAPAVVVANVLLIVAWTSAASRATFELQVPYLYVAFFGLILEYVAFAIYLRAERRALRNRALLLLGRPPTRSTALMKPSSERLVASAGGIWIHRSDCPLVEGRRRPDASLDSGAAGRGQRRRCPACLS